MTRMTSSFLAFWTNTPAYLARTLFLLTESRILNTSLFFLVQFYFVSWAFRCCPFLFLPEQPLFSCWLLLCLPACAAALPCHSLTSKPQSLLLKQVLTPLVSHLIFVFLFILLQISSSVFFVPPHFLYWLLFQASLPGQPSPSFFLWPTSPASTHVYSTIFHLILTLLWIQWFLCSTWLWSKQRRNESTAERRSGFTSCGWCCASKRNSKNSLVSCGLTAWKL